MSTSSSKARGAMGPRGPGRVYVSRRSGSSASEDSGGYVVCLDHIKQTHITPRLISYVERTIYHVPPTTYHLPRTTYHVPPHPAHQFVPKTMVREEDLRDRLGKLPNMPRRRAPNKAQYVNIMRLKSLFTHC